MLQQVGSLKFTRSSFIPLHPRITLVRGILRHQQNRPLTLNLVTLRLTHELRVPVIKIGFPKRFLLQIRNTSRLLSPYNKHHLCPGSYHSLLRHRCNPGVGLDTRRLLATGPLSVLRHLSHGLHRLRLTGSSCVNTLISTRHILRLNGNDTSSCLTHTDLCRHLSYPGTRHFSLRRTLLLDRSPVRQVHLARQLKRLPPGSVIRWARL